MGLCYNCFRETATAICPHCGFDPNTDAGKYPQALPYGSILAGKYIIGRVLGQGGFAFTYKAYEHQKGRLVAIKEFFPDTMVHREGNHSALPYSDARGEDFVYGKSTFLTEAQALAQFNGNPNVVSVYGYFEENNTAYFAMEFISGESLQSYLNRMGGRIPPDSAKTLLLPIMNALSEAHAHGLIHRDVKPDNIMLMADGGVKLIDFGSARYSLGEKSKSLDVVLTHGFSPWEQYSRHGKQGRYTDIYALAATFYYSVTGRKPPDAIDRLEADGLILPSSLGIRLQGREEDALVKALEVRPENRFQTIEEFRAAMWAEQEQLRRFTVTWRGGDGSPLKTDAEVPAGTVPVYDGAAPELPADARFEYRFAGWTPTVTAASADAEYTAIFSRAPRSYRIVWQDYDGTVLDVTAAPYGTVPSHEPPGRPSDGVHSYEFSGWVPAIAAVSGDAVYTASYLSSVRTCRVTWKNPDGSVIDVTEAPCGTVPDHEPPFRPSDGRNSYTFAAWVPQPAPLTGDTAYMATYDVRPLPPRPSVTAGAGRSQARAAASETPAAASEETHFPSTHHTSTHFASLHNTSVRGGSAALRDTGTGVSPAESGPEAGGKAERGKLRSLPPAVKICIPVVCCALIALGILLVTRGGSGKKAPEPVLASQAPVFTDAPQTTAAPAPVASTPAPAPAPTQTPRPLPSATPAPAPAKAPILSSGDWKYRLLEDGSAIIVGWDGKDAELAIPAELEGAPVSAIGERAFSSSRILTGVSIPHGVVSIEKYAFFNCSKLQALGLTGSMMRIGEFAFDRCRALTEVDFDGTPADWGAIVIEDGNQSLTDAELRFLSDEEGPEPPKDPDVQWIFYITPTAGTGGSINPSGTLWFPEDGSRSQTFTVTPHSGYAVSDVLVDGRSVGAVTSYTFSNISASHTIEARFSAVGGGGGGSGGGNGDSGSGSGGGSGSGDSGGGSGPTFDDGRELLELGGRSFYSDVSTLNLSGLSITDISVLAKCTHLKQLNLNRNNVSDLSPLKNLTTLTTLQLEYNNITDLSPLANLPNLEKLYLNGNSISDWSPVSFVPVVQGRPAN